MRRSFLCLFLTLILLLSLCACGGTAAGSEPAPAVTSEPAAAEPTAAPVEAASVPEATAEPVDDGMAYAEAYMNYLSVSSALTDEVSSRVDANNSVLESMNPDSYYMHSNYLMLVYVPFSTAYPGLMSGLSAANVDAAEDLLRQLWPDAVLTCTAPGCYEANYTYSDKTGSEVIERNGAVTVSGETVERAGSCIWECDGATGAIRVRAYLDGELVEFTEFVPQGNDLYLLYTMNDLALVKYVDGSVLSLYHAHRISEAALGSFPGDMRLFSLDNNDYFPAGTVEASSITEDPDCQYILVMENDTMTYYGQIAQDLLDAESERVGIVWQSIDPIVLLK